MTTHPEIIGSIVDPTTDKYKRWLNYSTQDVLRDIEEWSHANDKASPQSGAYIRGLAGTYPSSIWPTGVDIFCQANPYDDDLLVTLTGEHGYLSRSIPWPTDTQVLQFFTLDAIEEKLDEMVGAGSISRREAIAAEISELIHRISP